MTLLTICQATFSNTKEVVVDTKAPANPYKGLSWTDTSKTPPVTKVWDGSKWVDSIADAVDGIEIGGRNLIKKTAYSYRKDNGVTISYSDAGYLTAKGTTADARNVTIVRLTDVTGLSGNYTFSVERVTGNDVVYNLSLYQNGTVKRSVQIKAGADSITFDGTGYDLGYISIANTASGRSIDLKVRFKLEKGNKVTDWTPAPEDAQAEIDAANAVIQTHTEKLSTHEAKISSNETEINLRVTTSDFKSYEATVNGELASAKSRLSASESSISTLQDQITLKVEQKDIQTAVNNIQIGGRNLLLDSATKKLKAYQGSTLTFTENVAVEEWGAKDAIGVTGSCGTSNILGVLSGASCSPSVNGMSYVHSIYIKNNGVATIAVTNNNLGGKVTIAFGESKRVVMYGKGNGTAWLQLNVTSDSMAAFDFVYWHPKIEEGTKVTDWTPAPEDVDNKFASYSTTAQMQSAIDLAKDSITTAVSQTYAKKSEVSTVSGKVSSLETWKAEASQKITKDGIIATVGNYYAYQNDLAAAENRITTAESTITQHTDQIALRVEKSGIISAINQTAESIKISADKITLEGATIADSFMATNLHITGNSTFDGTLNGATGSFSGSVTATDGYIGDLQITSGYLLGVNGNVQTIVGTDVISIGIPNNIHHFSASSDGIVNAYNIYANGLIDATGSITSAGNIKAASMTSTGSLTAASATVSGSLKAATITATGSLTAASVTLKSGGLQLPTHTGTSWTNSPTFTKCIVATPHTNTSYYPIIRQNTKTGNVFTLGGFSGTNERFGIFGCKEGCPSGTYDYGAFLDVTAGVYYLVRCNVNVTEGDVRINGGLRVIENLIADGSITASGKISTSDAIEVDGTVHLHNVYSYQSTEAANVRVGSTGRIARASSSSVRYKDLVSELSAGDIEPLYDIPVHWFKYKEGYIGAEDERYRKNIPGFIVEDWEGVMSIAIDHNPDGSPEMWNNNIVVPLMFEMIKNEHKCNTEVRDSLQDCDRRIYTAEAWISSAEDRIDVLQDQLAAARDEINALRVKIAEQDALIAGLGAA